MLRAFMTEAPEGWPFNDLERALQRAATDPSARRPFWDALLRSDVFLIGEVSGMTADGVAGPDTTMRLMTVPLEAGPAIAAFTSQEILSRSITQEARLVGLAFRDLVKSVDGARIALNPVGPYGKELTPDEIRLALGGVFVQDDRRVEVAAGTRLVLGRLASEPDDLVNAVRRACSSEPRIRRVLLSGVMVPGAGETSAHPLLGFECDDRERALSVLGPAIQPWSASTRTIVDLVDLADQGALADHLRTDGRVIHP